MHKSNPTSKKIPLHWQIFIGMFLGILIGFIFNKYGNNGSLDFGFMQFKIEYLSWMGDLFLKLLKAIVIPLIFCALINGISHMNVSQLGRVGLVSFIVFKVLMLIAAIIGLIWVNILKPGQGFDVSIFQRVGGNAEHLADLTGHIHATGDGFIDFVNHIVALFPVNIFDALSDQNQLIQVIIGALFLGIAITVMGDKAKTVKHFFDELFAVVLTIVHWIMKLAPYGAFGMLAFNIQRAGFSVFGQVGMYMITVLLGLLTMLLVVIPAILWFYNGVSPLRFFTGVKDAMLTSFSTASTAATIPVSIECITDNLGMPKALANFIIPTAATMSMVGAALYEGVVTLFLAQAYAAVNPNIDLSLGGQLFILLMVVLSTLGTPGIPYGGLITTTIVLKAVGLPLDALGLILGVDRFLDMARTMTNTTVGCASAIIINKIVGPDVGNHEEDND